MCTVRDSCVFQNRETLGKRPLVSNVKSHAETAKVGKARLSTMILIFAEDQRMTISCKSLFGLCFLVGFWI